MYTVPRATISRSVLSSMSTACSRESGPARTASRAPLGPYEWMAIFFAIGVCHVHRRLHLFERERLVGVDVVETADRSEHLDHVRACGDLLAYGFHHFGRT